MLEELNKKERTMIWLKENVDLLQCIHCNLALQPVEGGLICENQHRFDITKKGYFFIASKASATKYDDNLFHSRREIILNSPLYSALNDYLVDCLKVYHKPTVLDAGSGEGSHLWKIYQDLSQKGVYIGVDLAKEGVQLATDYNGHILTIVADLANIPIQNHKVDVVLSLFSPANYAEFIRLLKPQGELIKVVPNSNYLYEIRECMHQLNLTQALSYSNDDVIDIFQRRFKQIKREKLSNQVKLTIEQRAHLLNMTPLTWQLKPEEKEQLLQILPEAITVDLTVLHTKRGAVSLVP